MSVLYSVGQMNQVGDAFENTGFTSAEVEKIRAVLNGLAEIQVVKHLIDCDTPPASYNKWKVEEHHKGGQLIWNQTKVKLHLSPNQAERKSIQGHKLRVELAKEPVLNANVLDYLLINLHLIPEEWKVNEKGQTRYIFFWGTIYNHLNVNLFVRFLYWGDGRWQTDTRFLYNYWGVHRPSAVSAK